ncbi:VCBS repeat-containing protein [Zunongwangia sp. F363]|uniref:VCBS repeat-containing protein n=1 Tax=Autumnicola tepida TaxID=3075595 RepID=A0ABU3C7E2_9FLAO|nr:VCBS repeat-containing protein [Zunongwangia sp. F363]MDT0642242.1 VCBS repeat-containing protein [Zunongwangia sp. F363]
MPCRIKILLAILAFGCVQSSCSDKKRGEPTQFQKLDRDQTGISFKNSIKENDSLNFFTYSYIYLGGGLAAGDINNDGLTDLFFTGNMVPNKLYLNTGNLSFKDITEEAGVAGDKRWFTGVTMADVNNDGFLDIYCSVGGMDKPQKNILYINNTDGTFTDKAAEYGVDDEGNSIQATFFDYDLDGDLDLYVANYPPTAFSANNAFYKFKTENVKDIETDHLYRNDGGHFTNVTDASGLRSFGLTLSATVGDLNEDGWPDLYVSNDFSTPDYLYLNNQDGTFKEVVKDATRQTSFYGMGADIGDYNNDGFLDILQVDMAPKNNRRAKSNMSSMNPNIFWSTVNSGFHYQYMQNTLQTHSGVINKNIPQYNNTSRLAGLSSTDWSWGPLFADFDNDGLKDVFVSNGTRREINNRDFFNKLAQDPNKRDSLLQKNLAIPSEKIDNFIFRNKGDLTFERTNEKWGISFKGFSNGSVYVDLDNDGDLEIVTNNIDDYASVFKNNNINKNNYLDFQLKGPQKNLNGLGTRIYVTTSKDTQMQELTLTRGFQSSIAPKLHFGVGKEDRVQEVKVIWPDKKTQILKEVPVNKLMELDYTNSTIAENKNLKKEPPLFTTVSADSLGLHHKHIENLYNDFDKEILLPHKTSMFGPALAVGDLNGDGLDDMYIGGASGYTAGIYFQNKNGFEKQNFPDITKDKKYEDLGALIFDADNDGDKDLYVVSGGNEFHKDSERLQDRLYVNENGQFKKSLTALPRMITSGSRVYAEDFDKDGDIDLFVGGRLVPGNYPAPADSYLLENKSSKGIPKFENITDAAAPGFKKLGLVTSASWTDFDGDGWTDLIIAGEWMPLKVFKNQEGKFTDITRQMGLEETTGWWFSLKAGDFDQDGDMDFIAGNLGLNYKYQAKEKETFDIYFYDFDNNNEKDIVLSYFNDGEKFPVRGRECSSQQMPGIKYKFKNYQSFSEATLEDIYTEEYLEDALHYQVKSFASLYIENSEGGFKLHKLPVEAQVSSINQVLIEDFDYDGYPDALIAGNLYSSEIETPRADAGIGLFLKGNGKGGFNPVPARNSGFFVPGDVKDMAMLNTPIGRFVVAAKNNDSIQIIKLNKKQNTLLTSGKEERKKNLKNQDAITQNIQFLSN